MGHRLKAHLPHFLSSSLLMSKKAVGRWPKYLDPCLPVGILEEAPTFKPAEPFGEWTSLWKIFFLSLSLSLFVCSCFQIIKNIFWKNHDTLLILLGEFSHDKKLLHFQLIFLQITCPYSYYRCFPLICIFNSLFIIPSADFLYPAQNPRFPDSSVNTRHQLQYEHSLWALMSLSFTVTCIGSCH